MTPKPEEAREALVTLNKIGVDGVDASWAISHRDEISNAFDTLQAFVSEAERLQTENAALREVAQSVAETVPTVVAHQYNYPADIPILERLSETVDKAQDLLNQ